MSVFARGARRTPALTADVITTAARKLLTLPAGVAKHAASIQTPNARTREQSMARRCAVTGKGVQTGNNVSHSNIKSKRRFLPNLQVTSLMSDSLNRTVRVRLSAHGLRTVEHMGGLDAFLLKASTADLTPDLRRIKRLVIKARSQAEGTAAA